MSARVDIKAYGRQDSNLYGLSRGDESQCPAASRAAVYTSFTTPALILIIRAVQAILSSSSIGALQIRVPATGLTSVLGQEIRDVRPFLLAHAGQAKQRGPYLASSCRSPSLTGYYPLAISNPLESVLSCA